jgi:hypothetical protein
MRDAKEWLDEMASEDPDLIVWDGMDEAIVGVVDRCGGPRCLCYDYDKMVALLVAREGMSEDEVREYLDFNVVGAYVGERTPFTLYQSHP